MSTSIGALQGEDDEVPPLRQRFPRRTVTIGPGTAAKAVAEDLSALVKAEVALAKAELVAGIKPKARGAAFLVAAGILVVGASLVLLAAAVLLVDLLLPPWAAALVVALVLLLAAGGLALLARKSLAAGSLSMDTTKHNVEEDVAWAKAHLAARDDSAPSTADEPRPPAGART